MIYKPGDIVPSLGKIETNNAGMPWLCGMIEGRPGLFMGVLQIGKDLIDAKTGRILSQKQIHSRFNNPHYDYENRMGTKVYKYNFKIHLISSKRYLPSDLRTWLLCHLENRLKEEKLRGTTSIRKIEVRKQ